MTTERMLELLLILTLPSNEDPITESNKYNRYKELSEEFLSSYRIENTIKS